MMPDVSGLDILEEISSEAARGKLPVLVLTGSDSRDLRQHALGLGAFEFLAKPVGADVFDALSSKRPYKPAFTLAKCLDILEAGRGTQFESWVLDAFFARTNEIVSIQIAHADVE